ncbi:hypothetical protein FKP32DRAFT_763452 [Trametes sanguinea]|nr:hypothetical protein FKP32DRAFT_763452 [Trametes sanguinea]
MRITYAKQIMTSGFRKRLQRGWNGERNLSRDCIPFVESGELRRMFRWQSIDSGLTMVGVRPSMQDHGAGAHSNIDREIDASCERQDVCPSVPQTLGHQHSSQRHCAVPQLPTNRHGDELGSGITMIARAWGDVPGKDGYHWQPPLTAGYHWRVGARRTVRNSPVLTPSDLSWATVRKIAVLSRGRMQCDAMTRVGCPC